MSASAKGSHGVYAVRPGQGRRSSGLLPWVAALAAAALALAGCSPKAGGPEPSGSPTQSTTGSATAAPSGMPTKVFTDEELMAVVNGVAQKRGVPYGAQDTQRLRIAFTANSGPARTAVAAPSECQAFLEKSPEETAGDKSVSFAMGALPLEGGSGGPTSTVMFTVRSAAGDALRGSQFAYDDGLASRCGTFDVAYTERSNTWASTVQMLPPPQIGEKALATLQSAKPRNPGDQGGVALRVLAGTLSVSLSLSVASDADAQPALGSMAGIARELIDQAANNAPTVTPPAPNSRTPEQLAALIQGVTGPGGNAPMLQAQLIRSSGTTPAAATCTYDDAAYFGALAGSSMAQAQFSGAAAKSYTSITVISMADSVAQPYPFDARAASLRDCQSITENALGGVQGRPWSSLRQLSGAPGGDAAYSVVHELSDGTGEKHLSIGARRGTLTVEATDLVRSDAEVQPAADALTALINQVFAKAGL